MTNLTTPNVEGDTMNEKELNKRYRSIVRKSHPRSGAPWQQTDEVYRKPCGESSPYGNYAAQSAHGEDGETKEAPFANPDEHVIAPHADIQSAQLAKDIEKEVTGRVRKMLDLAKQVLTEQQYNVFVMLAVKEPCLTEREAAKVLSITPGRVHQLWVKAQTKLQKIYTERT